MRVGQIGSCRGDFQALATTWTHASQASVLQAHREVKAQGFGCLPAECGLRLCRHRHRPLPRFRFLSPHPRPKSPQLARRRELTRALLRSGRRQGATTSATWQIGVLASHHQHALPAEVFAVAAAAKSTDQPGAISPSTSCRFLR